MNKNLKKLIKQSYNLTPTLKNYETLAMMLVDYSFEKKEICMRYQSVDQEQLPEDFTDLNCRRAMMDFLIDKYRNDIIRKTDNMELSDITDDEKEAIGKLYGQVEDFIIENICKILDLSIVLKRRKQMDKALLKLIYESYDKNPPISNEAEAIGTIIVSYDESKKNYISRYICDSENKSAPDYNIGILRVMLRELIIQYGDVLDNENIEKIIDASNDIRFEIEDAIINKIREISTKDPSNDDLINNIKGNPGFVETANKNQIYDRYAEYRDEIEKQDHL
jgi:hypothetical protein